DDPVAAADERDAQPEEAEHRQDDPEVGDHGFLSLASRQWDSAAAASATPSWSTSETATARSSGGMVTPVMSSGKTRTSRPIDRPCPKTGSSTSLRGPG